MDSKIRIEELEEQTALYADTICMLKEILNVIICDPDKITNPYRLIVSDYRDFLRICRYMDEQELKTIGTKTIMGILKNRTEMEIIVLLMNFRSMGLVELKLINSRVSASLRGTPLFYEIRKKRIAKEKENE